MRKPLEAGLMVIALVGCSEEPAPIRDVSFFLANTSHHEAALAHCRSNPGTLRSDANCRNAEEANRKVMIWGRDAALKRASN